MAKNKHKRAKSARKASADAGAVTFSGFDDPNMLEYIRHGTDMQPHIGENRVLAMAALHRCVVLISESVGMLPLNLMSSGEDRENQNGNPIYRLLKRKPNGWQTAYEFKRLLQGWVLEHGNAYARVIRSGKRVLQLIPMHPSRVTVEQNGSWELEYVYTTPGGSVVNLKAEEVLHLRDYSEDGIKGISRVSMAKKALGIAFDAEEAAGRTFKDGMMAGGALSTEKVLSDEAYNRLDTSMRDRYSGAKNAGRFLILEDGLKAEKWANTAVDAQLLQSRNHQIEEIARFFGVPRPLLMMDDTSWGSGISELGIFFVKYGLNPWFSMWEQALARTLLSDSEQDRLMFKFNPGALLRGSLKDQSEYFSKALGAGGTQPWMTQHEVRDMCDLPRTDDNDADSLKNPMTLIKKTQQKEPGNESDETS